MLLDYFVLQSFGGNSLLKKLFLQKEEMFENCPHQNQPINAKVHIL